ncbi:boophilin-H2-like [Culicoides brevitarsis]|uniref:boophilin-H2-like n=1 Tax=Culicoides brevitarsis TaxID=469753 RepID=UPI00307C85B7
MFAAKTSKAMPLSIYDFLISDAKFLSDVGEYYFGADETEDGELKRVVRQENSDRNGSAGDKCMLPMRKGYCRALIPRFSYDPSKGTCIEFKFGGCDGNANNFLSFDQCMNACGKGKKLHQHSLNDARFDDF